MLFWLFFAECFDQVWKVADELLSLGFLVFLLLEVGLHGRVDIRVIDVLFKLHHLLHFPSAYLNPEVVFGLASDPESESPDTENPEHCLPLIDQNPEVVHEHEYDIHADNKEMQTDHYDETPSPSNPCCVSRKTPSREDTEMKDSSKNDSFFKHVKQPQPLRLQGLGAHVEVEHKALNQHED